eukprot:TRINITY_DN19309_c0_g2_i1.p1 TRINITY_DN19309_c0_g2~~TRINITY_DN19309_c0_g2_i1.p1  ORF type:complete len:440 (+),score=34.94 TRINITY_DN19309_c0_g2_i1:111-1322(+)
MAAAPREQGMKDFLSHARDIDLYELFELERYACRDASGQFEHQIKTKFKEFALKYHPDKNSLEDEKTKSDCADVLVYITKGKDILLDPDAKHRYDIELRRTRKEESYWEASLWWSRWIFNASLLVAGGVGLLVGGLAAGGAAGGVALALPIACSSMLSAGIRGSCIHYQDPHATNYDYAKQIWIGGLIGAIGGACAAAVQGATIGAQVGIASAGGAGTAVATHVIEDSMNVLDGTRSAEDLVTIEHLSTIGTSIAIGACAGIAVQGVACGLQTGAQGSQQIVDASAGVSQNEAISTVISAVTSLAKQGVELQRGSYARTTCRIRRRTRCGTARCYLTEMDQPKHINDTGLFKDGRKVPLTRFLLEAAEAKVRVNAEKGYPQESSYFESILTAWGMTMGCSVQA